MRERVILIMAVLVFLICCITNIIYAYENNLLRSYIKQNRYENAIGLLERALQNLSEELFDFLYYQL